MTAVAARGRSRVLVGGAALLVAGLRFALRARVPDDYDAIGFVRALDEFDLAKLQPHFPGYPVYVALGWLAHRVVRSPLDAAELVSAFAAAATAAALWRAGNGLAGPRAGWLAVALYAGAALPWVLGGAALSDGTATAFAALAFAWLVAPRRPFSSGVAIALMLGTRASYWPLALSWAILAARAVDRRRALRGGTVGLAAWLVPFVARVGPRALVGHARAHLVGHFTVWGGSVVTRPDAWERIVAFARDLFFDGLAPDPGLLAVAAALAAACIARPAARSVRVAILVAAPYALWALLAQNIVEQPRHVLPLVVAAIAALGVAAARRPIAGAALALAVAAAGIPVALAHARTAPAAALAARWVADHFPPRDTVVFGGRSLRFLDELSRRGDPARAIPARERTWMSEVYVDLERRDVMPRHVLVTSEVAGEPTHGARLTDGPTFCRDPRLDRQRACLTMREYHLPGVVP